MERVNAFSFYCIEVLTPRYTKNADVDEGKNPSAVMGFSSS